MELGRLIEGLDVRLADRRFASVRICDITEDSRTVLPGSLYIARKGETADGNAFIPAALDAGAVAILSDNPGASLPATPHHQAAALLTSPNVPLAAAHLGERFYANPSSKLVVFGVTGTNGKTTTTYLVHQILNAAHVRAGLIGTVFIDDGVEVAPASMTTPPALELSRTLARMLEAGCQAVVVEVSSHSLDQERVSALHFDAAAFTNLTGDHLDYHADMESYAAAKARLFTMLPETGVAVVNADDPWSPRLVRDCRAPIFATSNSPSLREGAGRWANVNVQASVAAKLRRATRWSTEAAFRGPWGEIDVTLPFVGPHNLMNALEAATLVWAAAHCPESPLGDHAFDMPSIGAALGHAALPPGRLQLLTAPTDPITVYVDYAHTDDALRTVLSVFREVLARNAAQGRLVVVFGCGGDRDRTKRPRMGAVAAELAGRVFVTSDNPRSEEPRSIIDAIVSGMPGEARSRTTIEPDRERAIHAAIAEATDGDIIVIAGKGHEDYQVLPDPSGRGTIKRFFDDRLVARDALGARGIKAVNPVPAIVAPHAPARHTHTLESTSSPRTETP